MFIRSLGKLSGLSVIALLATVSPAEAAPATLGAVLKSVGDSVAGFPTVLAGVAYLAGLYYVVVGIYKFKDHVDNPSQNPISSGIKRFLAGGMLFALPYMTQVVVDSFFNGSRASLGAAKQQAAASAGVDKMIIDLVTDFTGPMMYVINAFCYISAIILLITGIVRLTKTAQEGPRGPTGLGTIMTFVVSGALFSFGGMMASFSQAIFGKSTVSTYAVIDPTIIGATAAQQVAPVIDAVMIFIMIVGFIAFARGWFVLKAFADGGSQSASIAQALTFLFGGALAINLGELVNVLQTTVGVTGITFN
jgi:hypothetical protein